MIKNNLIHTLNEAERKNYYYCTASIKVTEGNDYNFVYNEFVAFVKQTILLEEGCIEFFIVPSNPEAREFILWEIWKNEDAFYLHHSAQHTKDFFNKKLTEVKWFEAASLQP